MDDGRFWLGALRDILSQLERLLSRPYLTEENLHDIRRLSWELADLSGDVLQYLIDGYMSPRLEDLRP